MVDVLEANKKDALGWTAIHHAAFNNCINDVIILKNNGFDINYQTTIEQFTPLFIATSNNNLETVILLLELGADPNISDLNGRIPLDITTENTMLNDIFRARFNAENWLKRLLPIVRKLLANSIFQAILRIFIASFLEIFKDNLHSVMTRSLQLFIVAHPYISAIFYRLSSYCIIRVTPIFHIICGIYLNLKILVNALTAVTLPLITMFASIFSASLSIWLWAVFNVISIPLTVILSALDVVRLMLLNIGLYILGFLGKFLWKIMSFNIVKNIISKLHCLVPILYGYIIRFFQPSQLAGNFAILLAKLASKLLHVFPYRIVKLSGYVAKKIGGENRFASDEELAVLSLVMVFFLIYVICFVVGVYVIGVVHLAFNFLNIVAYFDINFIYF
jgi:hypothetical protein